MVAASSKNMRAAINIVCGICFGITVTVLVIEVGDLYFVNDTITWRDEIKRYIAEKDWTAINDSEAKRTGKSVKLTCLVLTPHENFNETYSVFQKTWAKRCDNVIYFSDIVPLLENVVKVDNPNNREIEFDAEITFKALNYVYKKYYDQTDWFLKVIHYTFIVVENLKLFLSDKNASEPVYFSQKFSDKGKEFPSTYAGIVMSREAVRRVATAGSKIPKCQTSVQDESIAIARCFEMLGVQFGSSIDRNNRSRFHTSSVENIAVLDFVDWYLGMDVNANVTKLGIQSISPSAVSLAPCSGDYMMAVEYYIYHARRFGVVPIWVS